MSEFSAFFSLCSLLSVISNVNGTVSILPMENAKTFVNGNLVSESTVLHHVREKKMESWIGCSVEIRDFNLNCVSEDVFFFSLSFFKLTFYSHHFLLSTVMESSLSKLVKPNFPWWFILDLAGLVSSQLVFIANMGARLSRQVAVECSCFQADPGFMHHSNPIM